jgi:hypothetical protein
VTCVPHRYDLQADSCVNKEVESFNRKLQKQMKAFEHVKICKLSDNREHFTSHSFHMNPKGKFYIPINWASCIMVNLVRNHPMLVTLLPWMETKNSGLGETAKGKDLMMYGAKLLLLLLHSSSNVPVQYFPASVDTYEMYTHIFCNNL